MARELKFRAWDAKNNEMVYGVHLNDSKAVKPGYQWFSPQNTVHDADPMQYTGLKDKNGVEIYEGDIVKAQTGLVGSVHWDGSMLTYRVKWFGVPGSYLYIVHSWCEVIGNRYENPKLLEAK